MYTVVPKYVSYIIKFLLAQYDIKDIKNYLLSKSSPHSQIWDWHAQTPVMEGKGKKEKKNQYSLMPTAHDQAKFSGC